MKRLLLVSFFSFLGFIQMNAQFGFCVPDTMFADSTFGVFPPPLNDANPDGGIPEKACLNSDYFFTWTLKIPESIQSGALTIQVDSIVVQQTGSVNNLPPGMQYAMNPPSGVFLPADTLGCITVYGAPTVADSFDLEIVVRLYGPLAPGGQELTLPGPIPPEAEGLYRLYVEPEGSTECFVNTDDLLAASFSIENTPNPFSNFTNITITAERSDDLNFRVFDLVGNEVHTEAIQVNEGKNNFEFDGSHLSNGIYIYSIEKNGALISDKMVINR